MSEMICDFCSAPEPTREFPCRDFPSPAPLEMLAASVGSWLTCTDCAELVDTEQWDKLGARSWDSFVAEHTVAPEEVPLLRAYQKALHERFREHRILS